MNHNLKDAVRLQHMLNLTHKPPVWSFVLFRSGFIVTVSFFLHAVESGWPWVQRSTDERESFVLLLLYQLAS